MTYYKFPTHYEDMLSQLGREAANLAGSGSARSEERTALLMQSAIYLVGASICERLERIAEALGSDRPTPQSGQSSP